MQNPHVLPLLSFYCCLFKDIEVMFSGSLDLGRDLKTLIDRTNNEGISFLTIVLPSFFDDVLDCIENGTSNSHFLGFKQRNGRPIFLNGLTSYLLDNETLINESVKAGALRALRQICYSVKKVKLPCTDDRITAALFAYVCADEEVVDEGPQDFIEIGRYVITTIFSNDMDWDTVYPRPGKGAIGEKFPYFHQRFTSQIVAPSLVDFFGEACRYANDEHYHCDTQENICYNLPVRVTTVPKTLKSPRVIAVEPHWTMMYQQALKDLLVDAIELHPLTKGRINFANQSVNRSLALEASKTKHLATIDLSEASDRISNNSVIDVFRGHRFLCDALQATRTGEAYIPIFGKFELRKFASMGSATCFPVEAIMFFIGCLWALHKADRVEWTPSSVRKYAKMIHVYGDDIIIPSKYYSSIKSSFQTLGWKVNSKKCFSESHFRESCGIDAYAGFDITPVYVRMPFWLTSDRSKTLLSTVSSANLFFENGYEQTAFFLADMTVKLGFDVYTRPRGVLHGTWFEFPWRIAPHRLRRIKKDKPCTEPTRLPINGKTILSYTHVNEYKGLVNIMQKKNDALTGWQRLLMSLVDLSRVNYSSDDEDNRVTGDRERSILRGTGKVKYRWLRGL